MPLEKASAPSIGSLPPRNGGTLPALVVNPRRIDFAKFNLQRHSCPELESSAMSRNKRRPRTHMDSAAAGRVMAAAQHNPDSATARSAFDQRAVASLYPAVPDWIQWLYDRNPETARFCYQLCYPPIDAQGQIIGGRTTDTWWTRDRMYWAERQARNVVRARRFHEGSVAFAHTPELDDDDDFYAVWDAGQDWTGHWYSRDPA